jgi:co-chaperonin GroES (HSP10)
MSNFTAQGDYLLVEKIDYEEERTTDSGIIFKASQVLETSFAEATIISMGPGIPGPNGKISNHFDYSVGDVIFYNAADRIGVHNKFDVIRRHNVIAVVSNSDETD